MTRDRHVGQEPNANATNIGGPGLLAAATLPVPCLLGQAEAAGLERELELARRQIDIERRKQEEMVRERER